MVVVGVVVIVVVAVVIMIMRLHTSTLGGHSLSFCRAKQGIHRDGFVACSCDWRRWFGGQRLCEGKQRRIRGDV